MRTSTTLIAFAVAALLASSLATAAPDINRVKTGILPSGELYNLYTIQCSDNDLAAVAAMDGKRRWCINRSGELDCFARFDEASSKACAGADIAGNQPALDAASGGN